VDEALARRLVAAQFPELAVDRISRIGAGWDNTAFLIDDAWVFRFPRREVAVELLETEARVLPRLAPLVSLPIPVPRWLGRPSELYPWRFTGYRRLAGRALSDVALDEAARAAAAPVLGAFLRGLHAVRDDLGAPPDRLDRAELEARRPRLRERLVRLEATGLVADVSPWRDAIAAPLPAPSPERVLSHGDLYALHLLVDDAGAPSGVIDWGDVHVGDPAIDLGLGYGLFSGAARAAFFEAYGPVGAATRARARERALFHAVALALYGRDVGHAPAEREGLLALHRLLAGG
jgi:aminoglycoside phosphotransferase (APT) family kinase protein